jgi:hypothetical protein
MTTEHRDPSDSDQRRKADVEISYIKSAIRELADSHKDLRNTVIDNVTEIKVAIASHNAVHATSDARISALEQCLEDNKDMKKTVRGAIWGAICSLLASVLAVAFGMSKP